MGDGGGEVDGEVGCGKGAEQQAIYSPSKRSSNASRPARESAFIDNKQDHVHNSGEIGVYSAGGIYTPRPSL